MMKWHDSLEVGSEVFWVDPDSRGMRSGCSGIFVVSKIRNDDGNLEFVLSNEEGSETGAMIHEIRKVRESDRKKSEGPK